MFFPPAIVGKIYDDRTRLVLQRTIALLNDNLLIDLKHKLASGDYNGVFSEVQISGILQMVVGELDHRSIQYPRSSEESMDFTATNDLNHSQKDEIAEVVPTDPLLQYIYGNIEHYGFVSRADAQQFYQEQHLGSFDRFPKEFRRVVQKTRKSFDCRISRVAVPSLGSPQITLIYARERDKHRRNSWELAVHNYFLNGLVKLIEELGHELKHRHALPNGKYNDLFVESGTTSHTGHIEIKTGRTVNKKDFPEIKSSYLVITPWQRRRGKTKPVGKNKKRDPIPLGEADRVKAIISKLGDNYAVLAVSDSDFRQKLDAWINTGRLERYAKDPKHAAGKR